MINAVRAIVPNKSNNEIILVLQHFDNCVDKTVQAFMEGSASEVLKEWTVTGKKKPTQNKKKKNKPKPATEPSNSIPDSSKTISIQEEQSAPSSEKGGMNGYHVNGAINDTESVESLSEGLETLSIDARELEDPESAMPDALDRTGSVLQNGVSDFETKSLTMHSIQNSQQPRNAAKSLSRLTTETQFSNIGMEDVPLSTNRKLNHFLLSSNIEKSVKDLQRCTVSLARFRVVVKEEMDASIKKMKQAFAELESCLLLNQDPITNDPLVSMIVQLTDYLATGSDSIQNKLEPGNTVPGEIYAENLGSILRTKLSPKYYLQKYLKNVEIKEYVNVVYIIKSVHSIPQFLKGAFEPLGHRYILGPLLMDREVALLAEMDKVKTEAMEILLSRQKKAELLKKMTHVAVQMSEQQLVELRADIKLAFFTPVLFTSSLSERIRFIVTLREHLLQRLSNSLYKIKTGGRSSKTFQESLLLPDPVLGPHFVSERKYDEDLGRVARFTCDVETLKKSIDSFGQVSHPKNSYSARSRCSSVTSVSLSSPSDASAASSSTCASTPSLTNANKKIFAPGETPAAIANSSGRPYQPHREVLPGNRQGGQGYRPQGQKSSDPVNQGRGGQGYRPQGLKSSDPVNQGRHDSMGRYRNSSWYSSGSRYQNAPSQAPGNTSERGQTHSAGTNETGISMEPSPPTPSFKKGLPQRKPRTSQTEAVNS
ncbi:spermatogenesis-associated serine-rich protein 2 [Saguinus oedipus]|uniref:Spermatogenesis-associated serine-rich protein 2 n=1 Tax=Saguinus oedipus TaxID=9490 RepID=A0ABQ9UZA5_SAGOE|nr:spermatogenesis-associated serine-rich protein 2 [Saguinus oedipus]